MEPEIIKKIFNGRQELLSLPQTLAEVLRLVKDDHSTADQLAHVLTKDPALTTKILRVVNSAFYATQHKIGSMKQAVITLGQRQVTALALSSSVYNMTSNWETSFDRLRFWRHSLEVAIAARTIGEAIGYKPTEELFISGLLHDIGLLILENSYPKDFKRIWQQSSTDGNIIDLEEEVWGTNHARIARFLLEQWNLPDTVSSAVGSHHTVFLPETTDAEFIPSQIVNLANRISRFSISEQSRGMSIDNSENIETLISNLNINQDQMIQMEKEIFSKTIEEAKFLEMEIGSSDEILMEANRLLFSQYVEMNQLLKENKKLHQQIMYDKFEGLSLDSIRTTTGTFAEYMDDAAMQILRKAEEVRIAIESSIIEEMRLKMNDSMGSIIRGLETVNGMALELKNFTSVESSAYADQSNLSIIEEKLKQQLHKVKEVTK